MLLVEVDVRYQRQGIGNGRLCAPTTKKGLRSFLGSISYYRKFVKNISNLTAVLTPSTLHLAPSKVLLSEVMVRAFHKLKSSLVNLCVLTVPVLSDHFILQTDASARGLGAVLSVIRSGEELPVVYFTCQLRGAERNYSTAEMEALAVVASIEHFAHNLYGREFMSQTDHKALVNRMTSKTLNRRLQRFVLKLQQWHVKIVYREGDANSNADSLSRQEWSGIKQDSITIPGKMGSSIQHEEDERELPTATTAPDNHISPSEMPGRPTGEGRT